MFVKQDESIGLGQQKQIVLISYWTPSQCDLKSKVRVCLSQGQCAFAGCFVRL